MLEGAEFVSLEQLVHRIGKSREPFLVPQIGVFHTAQLPTHLVLHLRQLILVLSQGLVDR